MLVHPTSGHPEQEAHLRWEGPAHEGPRKGLLSKYPRTNDHETFLRAAWPTNKNGLSQFTCLSAQSASHWSGPTLELTLLCPASRSLPCHFRMTAIFPGYYTGRATHVHVRLHTEWETLKNGTFRSNRMIHTGQIFVPDNVNAQIDKVRRSPIVHPCRITDAL